MDIAVFWKQQLKTSGGMWWSEGAEFTGGRSMGSLVLCRTHSKPSNSLKVLEMCTPCVFNDHKPHMAIDIYIVC